MEPDFSEMTATELEWVSESLRREERRYRQGKHSKRADALLFARNRIDEVVDA